jgi:hypothetical protein
MYRQLHKTAHTQRFEEAWLKMLSTNTIQHILYQLELC